jgi:hypothetical protein
MHTGPGILSTRIKWLLIAAVVLAALALRLNAGLGRDLWEDEVIAASHAQQPLLHLPVEVMRFDVHPFLYFMQLDLWSALGSGDIWLRLNSLLWNFAAIGLVFAATRRLYGAASAWIAGSLFALCAPAVWMAQELRPYSWLYCLVIAAFYCIEKQFGRQDRGTGTMLGAIGFSVAIIYSHAIGFFAVFLLGLYALGRIIQTGARRADIVRWLLLSGACAVAALPPLAIDLARDANLAAGSGVLGDLAAWVPQLLLPRGDATLALALSGSIYLLVAAAGLAVRDTRLPAALFLVAPILIAASLDAAGMSFFKLNVFSTMIMPFFAIIAASLLTRLNPRLTVAGAAALGVALTGFSVIFLLNRTPTTGFKAASLMIAAQSKPGDIVYAPQQSIFWGMARYMAPSRRGWQLQVAPNTTPQWRRVYDRLGKTAVAYLGLEPATQILPASNGISLLVGNESLTQARAAPRLWLVTYRRADLPADFPPAQIGGLKPRPAIQVGFLRIQLYQ